MQQETVKCGKYHLKDFDEVEMDILQNVQRV